MTAFQQPNSKSVADQPQQAALSETSPVPSNAAELFEIYASLQALCRQATEYCQTSSAAATRQRGEIEVLSEWVRRLETNLREAKNHIETLGLALDRIKIVALNAGLEGARLGDLAGKALVSVSDELRTLTSRGLELLSEHVSTIEQMEADRQRLEAMTERIQSDLTELDSGLRDAAASEQKNAATLSRLASSLQQSTGMDVESAARLGKISEQARDLVALLTDLSKPEQQRAVKTAVLPALEPLLAWISSVAGKMP